MNTDDKTFIDEATLTVRSGAGGDGSKSFRREKFVPFGGPDGGNGGRGGDVVVCADGQLASLLDFRWQRRHVAKNGAGGEGRSKSGKDGAPVRLRVPVGTVLYDADTGELVADLDRDGIELVVA